jgi:hypothetical protein
MHELELAIEISIEKEKTYGPWSYSVLKGLGEIR